MFREVHSSIVVVVVVGLLSLSACGLQVTEEYCTSERFNARCSSTEILLIRRALYGRLAAGRCITAEYAHAIGCYSEVTSYVDDVCSGRSNCSLLVASLDSIAQPCAKDFKSYLEVTYECSRASFVDDCNSSNETRLKEKSGLLALFGRSANSSARHLFGSTCPWFIEVSQGQRINVTWQVTPATHSFSVDDGSSDNMNEGDSMEEDDDPHDSSTDLDADRLGAVLLETISCSLQLTFMETEGSGVTHRLCWNETREPRVVYLSRTNRLQIKVKSLMTPTVIQHLHISSNLDVHIKSKKEDGEQVSTNLKMLGRWRPHVLRYNVFGCPYSLLPSSATISKHGNDVAIVCNDSLEVFYVTCVGSQWIGEIGNCTKSAFRIRAPAMVSHPGGDYKRGVALAVLTGIGLGMVAGSFMLITICLLRRRSHDTVRQKSFVGQLKPVETDTSGISMTHNSCILHHRPCCTNLEPTKFHRIRPDSASRSVVLRTSEEAYWATKVDHSECSLYSHCSVGTNDTMTTPINQWPAIIEDSKYCGSLCRPTPTQNHEDAGVNTKRTDPQLLSIQSKLCLHLLGHQCQTNPTPPNNWDDERVAVGSHFADDPLTGHHHVDRSRQTRVDAVCTNTSTFEPDCQSNHGPLLLSCH